MAADAATGRFAVADGASTSFIPGLWARLLVERFRDAGPDEARSLVTKEGGWPQWLRTPARRWRAGAEDTVAAASERKRVLLHNRLVGEDSAAATFIGVRVDPSGGAWQAAAVGDSCLFHLRGGGLELSFPLAASGEFDATPDCLFSNRFDVPPPLHFASGDLREGDVLLLATDAMAKWLLRQHEAGPAVWRAALDVVLDETRPNGVPSLVERLRKDGAALDDDVGLLVVAMEIAPAGAVPPNQPPPQPLRRRGRWPVRIAPFVRVANRRTRRRQATYARAVAVCAAVALVLALAALWFGLDARRQLAALEDRVSRMSGADTTGSYLAKEDDGQPASPPAPRTDTLPAGTILWRGTAAGAAEVARLLREVEVERHAGGDGRDSVTFLAWVVATQTSGDTLVRVDGDRATAEAINARTTPQLGENVISLLTAPAPMTVVAREVEDEREWYQVRVSAAAPAEDEP